jgi:hypothetical protein
MKDFALLGALEIGVEGFQAMMQPKSNDQSMINPM